MTSKHRYRRSELYIILGFLGTFNMMQTASSPCGAHICLNWKIQNNRLVLICKVDALNFPITFYDPFYNETGFCVPHEPCISLLQRASITKNNTRHEIVLTIPLRIQLNGWWTCKYGDNNERAITEVTIQNDPLKTSNLINEIPQITKCWTLMMLWCTLGYVCSYLLIRLIIVLLTIGSKTFDFKRNKEMALIAFSLSVTIFALPVIVGNFEGKLCAVPQVFVIYGAIIGLTSCLLLNYRDQNGMESYKLLITNNNQQDSYVLVHEDDENNRLSFECVKGPDVDGTKIYRYKVNTGQMNRRQQTCL